VLLVLTALSDERECIAHFGDAYRAYMRGTKRFLPFVV
jgi:protein-S-isoprenylcysteine O-methyltransferase Ste14